MYRIVCEYDAEELHLSAEDGDGYSLWVGGAVDMSKVERADVVDYGEVALSYPSHTEFSYDLFDVAFMSAFEELEKPSVSDPNPAGAGIDAAFVYAGFLRGTDVFAVAEELEALSEVTSRLLTPTSCHALD